MRRPFYPSLTVFLIRFSLILLCADNLAGATRNDDQVPLSVIRALVFVTFIKKRPAEVVTA